MKALNFWRMHVKSDTFTLAFGRISRSTLAWQIIPWSMEIIWPLAYLVGPNRELPLLPKMAQAFPKREGQQNKDSREQPMAHRAIYKCEAFEFQLIPKSLSISLNLHPFLSCHYNLIAAVPIQNGPLPIQTVVNQSSTFAILPRKRRWSGKGNWKTESLAVQPSMKDTLMTSAIIYFKFVNHTEIHLIVLSIVSNVIPLLARGGCLGKNYRRKLGARSRNTWQSSCGYYTFGKFKPFRVFDEDRALIRTISRSTMAITTKCDSETGWT